MPSKSNNPPCPSGWDWPRRQHPDGVLKALCRGAKKGGSRLQLPVRPFQNGICHVPSGLPMSRPGPQSLASDSVPAKTDKCFEHLLEPSQSPVHFIPDTSEFPGHLPFGKEEIKTEKKTSRKTAPCGHYRPSQPLPRHSGRTPRLQGVFPAGRTCDVIARVRQPLGNYREESWKY